MSSKALRDAAVRLRWRAAIEAGVDFIATDHYDHSTGRGVNGRCAHRRLAAWCHAASSDTWLPIAGLETR